ncbi:hypothetical protein PAECIP112173_05040 [Paenibacillus sp. JJ-100]|nr:hypothetical protein PAECIP112173_05040 [Paenibacillus sp. JJ-100]
MCQCASNFTQRKRIARDQISAQFLTAFTFLRNYNRFLHRLDFAKLLFNLTDFNPEPTNFYLMVNPSQVLHISVWQPASEISRPVKAFSWGKRMFHKFFGCKLWLIQVTSRKSHACHTQLAFNSRGDKLQMSIHNKNLVIGQRSSDRNHFMILLLLISIPKHCYNGSFRRTIRIKIVDLRFPLLHEFSRYRRASRYKFRQAWKAIRVQICAIRRRQNSCRDCMLVHITLKQASVKNGLGRWNVQSRTKIERFEHFPAGSIE